MRDGALEPNRMLTEDSFNNLLEALDSDRHRAAQGYEHLRRSLIKYFGWRGSIYSERDADETIDRVAHKLGEDIVIDDLYTYSLGVARNVAFESLRAQSKEVASLDESPILINDSKEQEEFDRRFDCFEDCLAQLPAAKRDLILAYYDGDKQAKIANRKRIADEAGIPIGRLRIQAHRIRDTLEQCITNCLSEKVD